MRKNIYVDCRNEMKENELKPIRCGCGGGAQVVFPFGNTDMYLIECDECGICTSSYNTKSEAVTAWNTAMSGVVPQPCTTPNGAYTGGCTFTNTTDPNKDFHPVRDFMVGTERTAKVVEDLDLECEKCNQWLKRGWKFCPMCGCRLEWE